MTCMCQGSESRVVGRDLRMWPYVPFNTTMLVHRGVQCCLTGVSKDVEVQELPRREDDPPDLIRGTVRVTSRMVKTQQNQIQA